MIKYNPDKRIWYTDKLTGKRRFIGKPTRKDWVERLPLRDHRHADYYSELDQNECNEIIEQLTKKDNTL